MDIYYIIVSSIAIIILILILTYIGISMRYSKGKVAYPPHAATCPDTWSLASDGSSCLVPSRGTLNVGKLYEMGSERNTFGGGGTYPNNMTINFAHDGWTKGGMSAQCSQKAWANQMGIQWDGVANYNKC